MYYGDVVKCFLAIPVFFCIPFHVKGYMDCKMTKVTELQGGGSEMRWRSLNKVLSGALAIAVALSSGLMTAVGGIAQVSAADEEVNWALGKPYTSSLPDDYYHSNNDPDLTKFADGVYGTSWEVNTVGFYAGPTEEPATFEFTLGEQDYPITRVVVSGFADSGSGIGTCDVQVEYQSSDMLGTDEWLTVVTLPASGINEGAYDLSSDVDIGAAKVRFIVSGTNTWTFLDEIEMWGPNADYLAEAPVIDTDLNCEALIPTGKDATFTVEAHSVDGGELTYQWYKDGAPVEGEVSSSLSITGATADDAGRYYVKVTNNKGTYHESTNSRSIDMARVIPPLPCSPMACARKTALHRVTGWAATTVL